MTGKCVFFFFTNIDKELLLIKILTWKKMWKVYNSFA